MKKTKAEAELTEDDRDETMASSTMAGKVEAEINKESRSPEQELSVAGSKTSRLDQAMGKSYHEGAAFTFEQNLGIRLNRASGPDSCLSRSQVEAIEEHANKAVSDLHQSYFFRNQAVPSPEPTEKACSRINDDYAKYGTHTQIPGCLRSAKYLLEEDMLPLVPAIEFYCAWTGQLRKSQAMENAETAASVIA
ncbi:hypothetical protein LZ554_009227 [Drepanopeziza brunnea f. sp. 'monogermtubi']|nr:hypothetical protein LZ554_009227 [Drepanopeziza brunnea f. sp. 'monogermtubi']